MPETGSPGYSEPMSAEIADMWKFARDAGFSQELEALHRPCPGRALLAVAADWLLIALATMATVAFGWLAVPFSVLVIGNRQRALGNARLAGRVQQAVWGQLGKNMRTGRVAGNG